MPSLTFPLRRKPNRKGERFVQKLSLLRGTRSLPVPLLVYQPGLTAVPGGLRAVSALRAMVSIEVGTWSVAAEDLHAALVFLYKLHSCGFSSPKYMRKCFVPKFIRLHRG